jgi:hypothetical protein
MNHLESLQGSLGAGMKHRNEVRPKKVSLQYQIHALNVKQPRWMSPMEMKGTLKNEMGKKDMKWDC